MFRGLHHIISIGARAPASASATAITMISLAFLTTWGQSGASGCRTINHWQLGGAKALRRAAFWRFRARANRFQISLRREAHLGKGIGAWLLEDIIGLKAQISSARSAYRRNRRPGAL